MEINIIAERIIEIAIGIAYIIVVLVSISIGMVAFFKIAILWLKMVMDTFR